MDYKIFIPVLVSFALSAIMGPVIIPVLRNLKMGQTEREEGVKEHLKKAGTPTMGGVIILLSILITSLFYIRSNPQIIPVLFVTIGFGLIGFLDDYLKVVMKRSDGLFPKQKMALQIVVTAIFAYYLVKVAGISLKMLVPFSGGRYLDLGWLAIPVLFFAVIGTVNGVNFTDGLDGLASSVTVLVATFFTVVAIGTEERDRACDRSSCRGAAWIPSVQCISGKRVYGRYRLPGIRRICGLPRRICFRCRYSLLIVGLIYLVEVLSVIIQVTYFKKTGGKRIFKMAPIHHHFELCGWSETRVVAVFSIITALLCMVALMAM